MLNLMKKGGLIFLILCCSVILALAGNANGDREGDRDRDRLQDDSCIFGVMDNSGSDLILAARGNGGQKKGQGGGQGGGQRDRLRDGSCLDD